MAPCKRAQHCGATLRRSQNNKNVWTCCAKFDRFQTIRNKCQQMPTLLWYHANGRNMLGPTMLSVVGQQCCVRLHGPLKQDVRREERLNCFQDGVSKSIFYSYSKVWCVTFFTIKITRLTVSLWINKSKLTNVSCNFFLLIVSLRGSFAFSRHSCSFKPEYSPARPCLLRTRFPVLGMKLEDR